MYVSPPEAAPAPFDEGPPPLQPSKPKRWPRRVVIGSAIFVAVSLVAAGALFGYVTWRFSQINRVDVAGLSRSQGGSPITILVVGSDSRANIKGADVKSFGSASQAAGQRSDTIMLVRLDPKAGSASLLSVPRDLWVPIAGKGYSQHINTAFDTGPALLVQTVEASLGIQVNHFVQVDFNSFRQIVNSLGGVKFWYPEPVRDTFSGLNITTPGCYGLSGDMALSLVRSRHLQYYAGGRWHDEAASDLARIRRQQAFVKKVAHRAQTSGLTDIGRLNGVVGGLVGNLTVDSAFSQSAMLSLAQRYRGFNPDQLTTATLPTTPAVIGGADVLTLDKPAAQTVIDTFTRAGAPAPAAPQSPPADPATIRITVLNASGRAGQAASATEALRAAGYGTGTPGTATAPAARSVVRYGTGAEIAAQAVQVRVGGGSDLQVDAALGPHDLVLVVGTGFTGITAVPTPAPPPPSPAGAPTPASVAATFPGPHGGDPAPAGSGC